MRDVLGILGHLGYGEIRPEVAARSEAVDAVDWRPVSNVNGRYGTTDETHVLIQKGRPTCRLVDRDGPVGSGQLVAMARKSCLVD